MSSMLEFQNICKYFPGVKALDNISFKAYAGEVLAFLGENGAGKSTLLKVLNGDYQPTSGKYLLDGVEKHFQSPHQAIEEGISVIYQERQILLELSVAENIYLGRMPVNRFGFIDTQKANQMASKIIEDFGLPIHPSTKVKDLSIAYQQMVEIMKAYSRENLKVICFDEPTASLSDSEIDALFKIIAKLKAEGKIIIYVSHRMEEIQRIQEYLDGLLHSVEGGSPADTARETEPGDTADGLYAEKEQETKKAGMSEEDDFLKSFEADTDLEGDADTFIRQFEDELDQAPGEERTQKTTEENNQFFKDLDGILDSARDADESTGGAEAAETAHASEDGDLMVDTIGDFQDDDSDLMDLLQSEGDFPDMSQMADPTAPAADTDAEMPDVTAMPETADEVQDEDDGKKKKRRKKKKKDEPDAGDEAPAKEKKSLIKRIGDALFGEEEETEEAPADTGELQPEGLEQAPELDDLSDENLKLLQELEGTGAAEPEAEAEPEMPPKK